VTAKSYFTYPGFLGTPLKEKISGSDLFPAFYEYHKNNEDIKIFLLGAREGVALEAQKKINSKIGRPIIVGAHSPSFGFEKDEEECSKMIELINQSGATVLAVGVGAPKQEKFICKYKDKLPNIKIFLAIGATIDFEAGNIKRAPKWVSEAGLEWLYRLLSEPKRLWKRYLVPDPAYTR
jgi:N-acetylglucosaminyldiphosphoundecaprenol N-acetyl-beta-D-mannosaminyltransferase